MPEFIFCHCSPPKWANYFNFYYRILWLPSCCGFLFNKFSWKIHWHFGCGSCCCCWRWCCLLYFAWRGVVKDGVGQRCCWEFMALCGLLAQFLNAQFQCPMHISTFTTSIVIIIITAVFVLWFLTASSLALFHFICSAWKKNQFAYTFSVIKLNC